MVPTFDTNYTHESSEVNLYILTKNHNLYQRSCATTDPDLKTFTKSQCLILSIHFFQKCTSPNNPRNCTTGIPEQDCVHAKT